MPRLDEPVRNVAFVLGAPRSGTTLLRVMLAGHPALFSPPEMLLAPFATMAERKAHLEQRYWEKGGLRRALMELQQLDVTSAKAAVNALDDLSVPEVYAKLQELAGPRLLVDKCPHLCAMPAAMKRLDQWYSDARFIWIVRHPGSVIRSIENMPMAEVMLQGYGTTTREIWHTANLAVADFLETVPQERWTRVRYEDLVRDPRPQMERICMTLGVAFDEKVLDPYEGDRMREGPKGARAIGDPNLASRGKIDPSLADRWLAGFDPRSVSAETYALALKLGYDLESMVLPPGAYLSQAMQSLFDKAQELERGIDLPLDLDATEGRRFLLRMLIASIDTFVEQDDPDRPRFHHAEGPTRKMFADCPDTDYLRASIRTDRGQIYRISGRLPTKTLYLGVLLYGKGGRIGRRLADSDLKLDEARRFELYIGRELPASLEDATFLQAEGDETAVIVRQYFADRDEEPSAHVVVERVDEVPAPAELDATKLRDQIERTERMLTSVFKRTTGAFQMARALPLNTFFEIPAESLFPTPDNQYRVAWFRFGYDQAMLVRGRLPKARYFSLCLYNAWLESYDYTCHQVSLNHEQIRTNDDGSFEVCLAHRDLGHPNWLDTSGHHAGFIVARHLLPEGDLAELETRVLYERELRSP